MRRLDIRNLPSTTTGLSRKGASVRYTGSQLVYRETSLDPKSINTMRSLARGDSVRVF